MHILLAQLSTLWTKRCLPRSKTLNSSVFGYSNIVVWCLWPPTSWYVSSLLFGSDFTSLIESIYLSFLFQIVCSLEWYTIPCTNYPFTFRFHTYPFREIPVPTLWTKWCLSWCQTPNSFVLIIPKQWYDAFGLPHLGMYLLYSLVQSSFIFMVSHTTISFWCMLYFSSLSISLFVIFAVLWTTKLWRCYCMMIIRRHEDANTRQVHLYLFLLLLP